jgi:hypothetical protein
MVVFFWTQDSVKRTDKLVIPYYMPRAGSINDTVRKYLDGNGSDVRTVVIVEPSHIIDSIDFTLFPKLRKLILAGDADQVQNRRYSFLDAPKLRKITLSLVGVQDSLHPFYNEGDWRDLKALIHRYRPDIKVRHTDTFEDSKLYNSLLPWATTLRAVGVRQAGMPPRYFVRSFQSSSGSMISMRFPSVS